MNLLTWNCAGGFAGKAERMLALHPDIAIVPECSEPDAATACQHAGYTSLWVGSDPSRGLAVFGAPGWRLEQIAVPKNRWISPIRVSGPEEFLLIAVWTCPETGSGYAAYVNEIASAIEANPEWFAEGHVVIAGDFNSSAKFDEKISRLCHSDVVNILADKGLASAYHMHTEQAHGAEEAATFHMYRHSDKPYHLDYIFIPVSWKERLGEVRIGEHQHWSKHSDHVPLSAALRPLAIA